MLTWLIFFWEARLYIVDSTMTFALRHRLKISNRIPRDQSFLFLTIDSSVENFRPLGPRFLQHRMNNAHSQMHYTREKSSPSPTLYEKTMLAHRDRWSSFITKYSFVTEVFFQRPPPRDVKVTPCIRYGNNIAKCIRNAHGLCLFTPRKELWLTELNSFYTIFKNFSWHDFLSK